MKYLLVALIILFFTSSCDNGRSKHKDTVIKYYNAFDVGDFSQIKNLIADSLTIIAGDYIMTFNQERYYERFKWDSIFQPSYRVLKTERMGAKLIATVQLSSLHHEFLENDSMICDYKISFESGRISKLEEVHCPDADWVLWGQKRDSLVNWIQVHHPELDGFIYDLTMSGAINYLKVIELYQHK